MWPFRVTPGSSLASLLVQLHSLAGDVKRLREDHEALAAAHERLRGRFYALKGVEEQKPKSKGEILREFAPRTWAPTHPKQE